MVRSDKIDMNSMTRHERKNRTRRSLVDPITLEVIRHGLVSITDQIDANISRTAFSPYIYEYKDFAVGLVSADGELIAQCTGGMPVFVADSVGMAVRDGLATYGAPASTTATWWCAIMPRFRASI